MRFQKPKVTYKVKQKADYVNNREGGSGKVNIRQNGSRADAGAIFSTAEVVF